jgi:hypothetical protein
MSDALSGLIPLYPFIEQHLPKSDGKPRSKRSAQLIVKKFNLPVVYVGWLALIDPELAAQRLREHMVDREPRKPGRPRTA